VICRRSLVAALAAALVSACATPQSERLLEPRSQNVAATRSEARSTPTRSTRVVDDEAHEASFAGLWTTTFGALVLEVDGTRATGRYAYGTGGRIDGEVDGRILRARYFEPDGVEGRATFELADDGASFDGVWQAGASADLALDDPSLERWSGTRVVPVEGRVWLVVLEAYWQSGLHEPDYSYGEMLGAFFERLPNVAFRQRFFHGPEDFVRLVRECEALAEPVVLYVSSHGSPEGIASPGGTIDGATIGAALAHVPNVQLLHLGACEALAGDLVRDVRAAAGPHADFPISGFTVAVDWGGSALVDFTYLDLVLERGFAPADAVEETRRLVTFARDTAPSESAIPATDLVIDVGPD
jgi:hypothetical protein